MFKLLDSLFEYFCTGLVFYWPVLTQVDDALRFLLIGIFLGKPVYYTNIRQ